MVSLIIGNSHAHVKRVLGLEEQRLTNALAHDSDVSETLGLHRGTDLRP